MEKILFVDNRLDEVERQWMLSGCGNNNELLPLEQFESVKRTCQIVKDLNPTIVVIGFGLGKGLVTGAEVIRHLRQQGYDGYVIANTGGSVEQFTRVGVQVDGTANKEPVGLKRALIEKEEKVRNEERELRKNRVRELGSLIQEGDIDRAIEMVRSADDYHEGESFVLMVLYKEESTSELVEEALKAFLGTRKHIYKEHGRWVHSLSQFTKTLWERNLYSWIKKFNEAAFKGANELGDHNCCDRLLIDFRRYSVADDNPVDFGITPENLRWFDSQPPEKLHRLDLEAVAIIKARMD